MNIDQTTPAAPVFGSVPTGTAAPVGAPFGAPFGAVPVGVPAPPRPPRLPIPAAAPAGPRPRAVAGPIRRAGLLYLAPLLALPLVLLVATEAGELDQPDVPVFQPVAGLSQPLTVTPASAASPSATPASAVTAVPVPAQSAVPPAADPSGEPAAADGDAGEPDAEAVPSTSGSSSKRPPAGRPNRPSTSAARPPARPAQPAPAPPAAGPVVPLPDGDAGGLCIAAEQAGQLPPNLLQLCHSVYGGR